MSRTVGFLMLVGAMALTGSNVPLGKAIVRELPVYQFLVVRFVVASIALYGIARWEGGVAALHPFRALTRRDWLNLWLMALIGTVLFTACLLEGTRLTSAADAGIIMATLPALIALASLWRRRAWPTWPEASSIGLAVAGLMLVEAAGAQMSGTTLLGDLLVCAAVGAEIGWVLLSRQASPALTPALLALAVNVIALGASLPLAALELLVRGPSAVGSLSLGGAVWYGLSASVICQILWFQGLPHVETWAAGLATAAIPVVALGLAFAALGEQVSLVQVLGCGLVIAAIILGAFKPQSAQT